MDKKERIEAIYRRQIRTVYRVCYALLQEAGRAEDLTQETFLRLIQKDPSFESQEHEKAWLIVTARNACKDFLKSREQQNVPLENYEEILEAAPPTAEVPEFLAGLPHEERLLLYLFYVEGYSGQELARLSGVNPSTLRSRLARARARLRDQVQFS